ncbi:MAG: hypothetical protein ACYDH6_03765 [Acidimicrobiales bacterium]
MSAVPDPAAARQERLARGVAGIRRRAGGIDLEKALQVAGSVLLPTGLIVILLGWWGASHTSYDFEQTPYLISGGLLGAAMVVAGGFLYFGYWLARLVHEGQRQRAQLAELVALLSAPATASSPAEQGQLVATATGSLIHRVDCGLVRGKSGLRRVTGVEPGLKPCRVCNPLSEVD